MFSKFHMFLALVITSPIVWLALLPADVWEKSVGKSVLSSFIESYSNADWKFIIPFSMFLAGAVGLIYEVFVKFVLPKISNPKCGFIINHKKDISLSDPPPYRERKNIRSIVPFIIEQTATALYKNGTTEHVLAPKQLAIFVGFELPIRTEQLVIENLSGEDVEFSTAGVTSKYAIVIIVDPKHVEYKISFNKKYHLS